eukprot:SAG22_NODE_3296_length_1797_cov_117.829800_1_plen_110_part_00
MPEGGTDLKTAVIFNGLKNLVENDFTMFVRGFQILFKFAGSLAIGSGRVRVLITICSSSEDESKVTLDSSTIGLDLDSSIVLDLGGAGHIKDPNVKKWQAQQTAVCRIY